MSWVSTESTGLSMKYVIADTETIGLNPPEPPHSGVVQVAWLEVCPETLAPVGDLVCELINPGVAIQPGASRVHGIYDEDVQNAPSLQNVIKFDDPIALICHNLPFDSRFLSPYMENIVGGLCTLSLSRSLVRGTPNHKLQTLAEHLALEKGEAHDAGGDVLTTFSLLKELVRISGRSLADLVDAARVPKHYHVMPFGVHKGKPISALPLPYIKWLLEREIDKDLRFSFEQQIKIRG